MATSGYAKCHRQSRSSGFSALRQLSQLTIAQHCVNLACLDLHHFSLSLTIPFP